ncbi:MAG TPA: DUF4921 family protein [Candidatus Paceibacterota bacterium]|nr:DUF4921 family protein [Candidatus Paceibacterota bacterium]
MLNEFRQDPVSGEWVLFATQRARKPAPSTASMLKMDKESCPFENPQEKGNEAPLLIFSHGKQAADLTDWTTQVFRNKFPALQYGICGPISVGPLFSTAVGYGFHELVVTRDHDRHFSSFTAAETAEVLTVYRERYRAIATDQCGDYIAIFHNHGYLAGASVYHNHSQIISVPFVPPMIVRDIDRAGAYFRTSGTRIHESVLAQELQEGKRVVFQNDRFAAICSYTSRVPYEIRIYPKYHQPYFADISDADVTACGEVLQTALARLDKVTGNADYTFLVHTAPPGEAKPEYDAFRWHIEIIPRVTMPAGFETSTNVYINVVDPDQAAEELRTATV